jgi:prevent-host-death family protein
MKTISSAEANRQFSSVLREVAQGEEFTVLSRGRSVASIIPITKAGLDRKGAKSTLMGRLRKQKATGARSWTRSELYDASPELS